MTTEVKYFMDVAYKRTNIDWKEELTESRRFPKPKTNEEAVEIARATIDFYNNTLRPGETPRVLMGVSKQIVVVKETNLKI